MSGDTSLITRMSYVRGVNIFALLSGLITVYLVFQGGYLIKFLSKTFEGDLIGIGFQGYEVIILGNDVDIPFLEYLMISSKLSYLIAGLSLIIGSLVKDRKLSRAFIGFKLPSITGLILALTYFTLSYLGGAPTDPSSIDIQLKLLAEGKIIQLTLKYISNVSPTFYLTILANVFAIVGRMAVKEVNNIQERLREVSASLFIPI